MYCCQVVQTVQRKYMRDYGGPYATGGLRTELIQERLEAIQREYVNIFAP